ncbi:MAG: glycoside hydrolase family 18 protein [Bacteroidales bacterium]|jgi:GH18 family chitinase|nr:glycoside hydrolase family 18 protein [Bacteroidales bacterium]
MKIRYLFFFIIILISAACSKEENEYPDNDLLIAAYLPYWGMDEVDLNSLQHLDILYYFSLAPDEDGLFEVPEGRISDINIIKGRLRSDALLFIVLGGWYESETIFPMFEDPAKRANYISQLVNFCLEHNIDGVDLDWEDYPWYIPPQDRSILTSQMSDSLRANGLFFSLALVPSQVTFSAGIHPAVDYINVMSYGVLDAQGRQVPLSMFQDYTYEHLYAGIPREKIIMGVPFYGKRPYREGDSSPRAYPYRYIVEMAHPLPDENSYGLYSFNGRTLIKQKTSFLIDNDIGGIMAWELSQDVTLGSPYSLFDAILDVAGR